MHWSALCSSISKGLCYYAVFACMVLPLSFEKCKVSAQGMYMCSLHCMKCKSLCNLLHHITCCGTGELRRLNVYIGFKNWSLM